MTRSWFSDLADLTLAHEPVVRVSVVIADGSAPRGPGAWMIVTANSSRGTIGGGRLELEALETARTMLTTVDRADGAAWRREVESYPLGPSLGQCCGGHVRLLYEVIGDREVAAMEDAVDQCRVDVIPAHRILALTPLSSGSAPVFVSHRKDDRDAWPLPLRRLVRDMLLGARPVEPVVVAGWYVEPLGPERAPLFLYGAGHVGRAVVKVLADLPFHIHWVDTDGGRFPEDIPSGVERLVAVDPARIVAHAPAAAWHVVMTFSHAIDFDVCRAVLARGDFAYAGVIASKTKRARFARRLRQSGISEAAIARLAAPIGLPGLDGKEPATITVSLAADLLLRLQAQSAAAHPLIGESRGKA